MKDMYNRSNSELLGIILGVAEDSLKLKGLSDIMDQPQAIAGIGEKRAEKLYAIREVAKRLMEEPARRMDTIRSPQDAYDYASPRLQYEDREHFAVIVLDIKHHIIDMPIISIGSLTASVVHPREVFREILKYPAAAFIMVHNHPSGDPEPSREDINITRQLASAGKMMDIPALDHIIIGRGQYNSLKEMGMMD